MTISAQRPVSGPMFWFGLASLTPVALLALGAVWGGLWPLAGLLSITVLVFFLDRLVSLTLPEDTTHDGMALSVALTLAHLALLPLVVWAVGAGAHLTLLDKLLLITGAGLWFGQVSNSNAHELIHRKGRWPRRLGKLVYASLLYGHHATAHLRVHHVHAATDRDPNSARIGEGFWVFAWRCARDEFAYGLRAENLARANARHEMSALSHPYLHYALISAAALIAAAMLAGPLGILALLVLSLYAATQLMLSDYVQHYGLRRAILADGRPEPIGPQHSWNAPRWYSSAMMLNAPRHSDHHMQPDRAFPALALDGDSMPILPQSLPVMAVIALIPPIWRGLMDDRAARWSAGARAQERVPARARDIPQAVLDYARGSGQARGDMPVSGHDAPTVRPRPDPRTGPGPRRLH